MQNGFESQILIEPVARLMEEFSRLPGIGPKTASRLVFFLLRAPDEQAHALAEAQNRESPNVRREQIRDSRKDLHVKAAINIFDADIIDVEHNQ